LSWRNSYSLAMNVAWTGHRPEYFANPPAVAAAVAALAAALQAEGESPLAFHCGGQRGVDTWAATAAERLNVPLYLYLPLPPIVFTADWPADDVAALERSRAYAVECVVVEPAAGASTVAGPAPAAAAAYSRRNWLLAERGDLLVAVWTGLGGGGTAETLAAARQLGRPVREHLFAGSGRVPRPGERGV
jgi:hypothetical protein